MSIKGARPNNRRIVAHIMVPDVAESIKFYREAFGAEELYSSTLPNGSVVHAQLKIADSVLLLTYENLGSQDAAVAGEDPGTTPRSPHSLGDDNHLGNVC